MMRSVSRQNANDVAATAAKDTAHWTACERAAHDVWSVDHMHE